MVLSINAEKNIQQNSTSIYDEENLEKNRKRGELSQLFKSIHKRPTPTV